MDIKISKRFPVKERRFLNIFLPVSICALVLEILALLVCIVVFAPLSDTVSNIFIFSIAITALLIFLVPFIMSFVSGYRGDKKQFRSKTSLENQTALESGKTVIESDAAIRKKYLRFPKILALLVCPSVFLLSGLALSLTKDHQAAFSVRLLRLPFLALAAAALVAFIPLLMYWANCSGTSLVQRIYLGQSSFRYSGYSGSMEERVEFSYALISLESFHVGRRAISIRGEFLKTTSDLYGVRNKGPFSKNLHIPRTFTKSQEQTLLAFLQEYSGKSGSGTAIAEE